MFFACKGQQILLFACGVFVFNGNDPSVNHPAETFQNSYLRFSLSLAEENIFACLPSTELQKKGRNFIH